MRPRPGNRAERRAGIARLWGCVRYHAGGNARGRARARRLRSQGWRRRNGADLRRAYRLGFYDGADHWRG